MGHFGEEQLRGIGDTGTIEGKESANDKSVRKGKKMDLIRNKKRLFDEIKYYCEENKLRAAYTEGMYGLCRHPGVLWFAGAYLCMWGMVGGWKHGIYFLLMIFWNYLYIIFQDLWTFPRTFFNYKEYQQSTPFLIPNRKSILVCLRTIRKND